MKKIYNSKKRGKQKGENKNEKNIWLNYFDDNRRNYKAKT
jgi:hypothetical protein